MKYTVLVAALATTTSFTIAMPLQERDDKPAFAEPFALGIWFKYDADKFQNNKTESIIVTGDLVSPSDNREYHVSGLWNFTTDMSKKAGSVAHIADVQFDGPTDLAREVEIKMLDEEKTYTCNITVPQEPDVSRVHWVLDYGLDMLSDEGHIPGSDFLNVNCTGTYWKSGGE